MELSQIEPKKTQEYTTEIENLAKSINSFTRYYQINNVGGPQKMLKMMDDIDKISKELKAA